MFGSVRSQLVVLFSIITAAAIGFIYLYVVPQLSSSLTAEKLRRLQARGGRAGTGARRRDRGGPLAGTSFAAWRCDSRSARGARLTVLGVREGSAGLRPAFVVADSQVERLGARAELSGRDHRADDGRRRERGRADLAASASARPPRALGPRASRGGSSVLSDSLADVDDNVSLITRQILIAGVIALAAALAAGFLAARAHSRRLRRLEAAAERVAHGDFSTPIPVDSDDEVGQLAMTLNEMRERLDRLDGARKEFIANASHELRTPIFSLGGFVELLDEEDPDPRARAEFVATMREQIDAPDQAHDRPPRPLEARRRRPRR